jgi:cytochrome c peroxidase
VKVTKCCVIYLTLVVITVSAQDRSDSQEYLGLPGQAPALQECCSPTAVSLGKKLFFDTRLSRDGTISCASCHQPDRAFADGSAVAQGVDSKRGTRNTPSLLNVAFNTSLFWDGRRLTLESQALDPFVNLSEHGFASHEQVLEIVRRDSAYVDAFSDAFAVKAAEIAEAHVAIAISSFERTLVAGDAPFDRHAFRQEQGALSESAKRGLALFRGSAGCYECHTIGDDNALFTDNSFHLSAAALRKLSGSDLSSLTSRAASAQRSDSVSTLMSEPDIAALGRFNVTLKPSDIGKFRTPSLRNVALTAPYMHDGSIATLEEAVAVELYNRSTLGRHRVIVTPQERSDIVDFLLALTSSRATGDSERGNGSRGSGK